MGFSCILTVVDHVQDGSLFPDFLFERIEFFPFEPVHTKAHLEGFSGAISVGSEYTHLHGLYFLLE